MTVPAICATVRHAASISGSIIKPTARPFSSASTRRVK